MRAPVGLGGREVVGREAGGSAPLAKLSGGWFLVGPRLGLMVAGAMLSHRWFVDSCIVISSKLLWSETVGNSWKMTMVTNNHYWWALMAVLVVSNGRSDNQHCKSHVPT